MVRNSATNPYFWNNLKNFKLYTMHIFWLRNYNITKYSLITLYSLLFSGNTLHDVQKHLKYILCTISLAISYVSHLFCANFCSVSINFNCNDENRILGK